MDATRLEFRGTAAEYFRVWIVNLLLTIATLGIYSAWAKVRKKKYFYRNTLLDGHSFDYHANPIAILKGRLIVLPFLIAYATSSYFLPGLDFVILLLVALLLPWLLVRSQIFNKRNNPTCASSKVEMLDPIVRAAHLIDNLCQATLLDLPDHVRVTTRRVLLDVIARLADVLEMFLVGRLQHIDS